MPNQRQFTVVDDEPGAPKSENSDAVMLALARKAMTLETLAQRTLVSLASLFTLLTMASAFALWWRVLPDPSVMQLVGLGIYAALVLAINILPGRK